MTNSGLFTLDWGSVADAILYAVVAAVVTALVGIVTAPGFDVMAANWAQIGDMMLNISIITAVVSLSKDFLSTNSGSLLGLTPPFSSQ